ncbi:acyl-CoA N-acyltransferase [Xylogone sp. PMI_703]|nr:acyl-CoA N-acyltransferase [Xylogone sp. PMI_703]
MERPVGPPAPTTPAMAPSRSPLHGQYTSLIPLQPEHSKSIFQHLGGEHNSHHWTYMFYSGFSDQEQCRDLIQQWSESSDPLYFAVLSGPETDPASEPAGLVSYLSIVPGHRRIEMGHIILGDQLKQTKAATESFFIMLKYAFEDLGYHRMEWKADNLNKPSLSAALRLGFTHEGIFRKHMIIKGKWRDTAWYSITADEWPAVKRGFEAWLDPENFDKEGRQLRGLKECRELPM